MLYLLIMINSFIY